MEPYLELISYIAPPAIYFPPVPETGRRRLFGGDYPAAFVGDSFRPFGGHDYGYVVPRTAKGGDMTKIRAFTKGIWASRSHLLWHWATRCSWGQGGA